MTDIDAELETFLAEHRSSLTRFASSIARDAGTAEELLQVALVRCYPKWHTIAPGRHAAYLRTAMVRENIAVWRLRRWREVLVDELPDDSLHPDHAEVLDLGDAIWRSLRRLPAKQRTAIALRFAMDWPINDVAAAMGVQPGTVKSLCSRGLAELKADPDLSDFQPNFSTSTYED